MIIVIITWQEALAAAALCFFTLMIWARSAGRPQLTLGMQLGLAAVALADGIISYRTDPLWLAASFLILSVTVMLLALISWRRRQRHLEPESLT